MEKMLILITSLFLAWVPEHEMTTLNKHYPVFYSPTACSITSITFDNIEFCNDNGTSTEGDDFFIADLLVEFIDPPATGELRIELGEHAIAGGGPLSVDVADIPTPGMYLFEDIRFKAIGTPAEVPVSFSAQPSCREVLTGGPVVESCSACAITSVSITNKSSCNNNGTGTAADDFFTADVTVAFTNPPVTGDLRIEPGGDALPGGGATSIPVTSLVGNTHTFFGVRFRADGATTIAEVEFSADNSCVRTGNTPGVSSCSQALVCIITSAGITNKSSCNNNGTTDPADDFFTADVTVAFTNPPATGNLEIEPGGDALPGGGATSVAVASLVGNTHTFTGVRFRADGLTTIAEVEFSADNGCVRTAGSEAVICCDLVITDAVATPESCPNANDGSIKVTATTSSGPLTYTISGPVNQSNNTGIFTGLPDGNYSILVTNNGTGNCTQTASATVAAGVDQTPSPPGFTGENIGNANGTNTFALCSGQKFTLTASGFSTASSDVQRFVSRQLCGNGEIIAHVVSVGGGGWAGITLRETTAPGSKKVALKTQFSNNIRREIRTTANGAVSNLNLLRPQDTWLRLVRSGSNFSGYTSTDGAIWNFAFATTITMSGCIRVGLFSESVNANVTTTAVFDQVTITGAAVPLMMPATGPVAFEMPDFQVYPNPTTGEVNLDLSAFAGQKVAIEVRNAQGQLQQTLALNLAEKAVEKLDFSGFFSGIYTITVKSEGRPVVAKRVVLMTR